MIRNTFIRVTTMVLPMVAASQVAGAQQQLPSAQALITKYVAAINGSAIMTAKSIVTKGGMSVPSAGINGTVQMTQAGTNQMQIVTNIPGMGDIQAGYDGTTAWAADPMQGPRILSGKEMEQIRDESDRRTTVRDAQLFTSMTTVADTTMNGEKCYEVKLVWKSGRETFDCYSAASALLVGTRSVQTTSMGPVPVVTLFNDYKKFGEIMAPAQSTIVTGMQQIVNTITSIEFGNGAVITPPPAIQALVKGKQ